MPLVSCSSRLVFCISKVYFLSSFSEVALHVSIITTSTKPASTSVCTAQKSIYNTRNFPRRLLLLASAAVLTPLRSLYSLSASSATTASDSSSSRLRTLLGLPPPLLFVLSKATIQNCSTRPKNWNRSIPYRQYLFMAPEQMKHPFFRHASRPDIAQRPQNA